MNAQKRIRRKENILIIKAAPDICNQNFNSIKISIRLLK